MKQQERYDYNSIKRNLENSKYLNSIRIGIKINSSKEYKKECLELLKSYDFYPAGIRVDKSYFGNDEVVIFIHNIDEDSNNWKYFYSKDAIKEFAKALEVTEEEL